MIRPLIFAFTMMTASASAGPMDDALKEAFAAGELEGLHAVYVLQHGEPLAESYFEGVDQRWGQDLGPVQHGPEELHDLRSVSKVITGLLYGIALSEGIVPDLDAPLVAQFPEYEDLASDPDRQRILIRHVLSMQMGIEWNEDLPYTSAANSEIAMEQAPDRIRFVLERPIISEPGAGFIYNGGATAVLGALVSRGAAMPLDQFAKERLFAPLGIDRFEWLGGEDGIPSAASGLRLRAQDLAKIGQLVLQDGNWRGQQIIPKDWLAAAQSPNVQAPPLQYGLHWWLAPSDPPAWSAGFGNGGQRFSINKKLGLVFVAFAGRYNDPEAWQLPVKVVTDYLAPILRGK
ncbi:serine hydrolase [uncultured Litoreibacter sp.]|uniref:serine hydrolase domain-containing protein n=1 Tax=uncultured Litoreibacter sp. TaxID=1392394 RepID=UPI002618FA12|nr:serine hydrolase [uncultured Litoreibacter sp.]